MSKKIHTEITIETERVVSISLRHAPSVVWCDRCQAHIPTVTPKQAALLMRVSDVILRQLIQSEQLHVIQECEGLPLICLHSLYHRN